MGRTGVCWDNSMAESFFSMLKNERVYRTVHTTKAQARKDLIQYTERFYNSRRRHSALGYRRPHEVHHGYHKSALAAETKPLITLSEMPAAAQVDPSRSPPERGKYHFDIRMQSPLKPEEWALACRDGIFHVRIKPRHSD